MKIKNALKFALILFVSVIISVLAGCGQQGQSKKVEDQSVEIDKEKVKADVSEIIKNIPSPFELSQKLNDIGADYIENAVNSVDNIDKYFTEKNKALNLGVYGADLAYVSTYEKKQEMNLYADAVKKLIDQLNITLDFASLASDETKSKMENKDTLVAMVTNTFYDVYDFLNENSDPALAALVATGIWVEGLYLAMQISDETFNNNEFVQIIYDQKNSLSKLIDLLDLFKEDQLLTAQKDALKKLNAQYDSTDGSLTIEQLKSIGQTVSTIRSGIVE